MSPPCGPARTEGSVGSPGIIPTGCRDDGRPSDRQEQRCAVRRVSFVGESTE